MTSRTRFIGFGAAVSVVLSATLMALSFATHSIWPIFPGVYVVASAFGIHNTSMILVALLNAILIWIATAGIQAVYRQRFGR